MSNNELNELTTETDTLINTEVVDTIPAITEPTEHYITFDVLKAELDNGKNYAEILTIKKYIPIVMKQIIVENIISACKKIDENGMTKINYVSYELNKAISLFEGYTNYSFTRKNLLSEYDYLSENGIIDNMLGNLATNEIYTIYDILREELEQVTKIENSMESIVNKHLWLLQDKIDEVIGKIPNIDEKFVSKAISKFGKIVGKFNPDSMNKINEMSEFVSGKNK